MVTEHNPGCPDFDDLLAPESQHHVDSCPACRDLRQLTATRTAPGAYTEACAEIEPLIAVMAIAPLDTQDRDRLDQHVAVCPRCLGLAAEAAIAANPTANAAPSPLAYPFEPEVSPRHRPRFALWAAVAGAAAAAVIAGSMLVGGTEHRRADDHSKDGREPVVVATRSPQAGPVAPVAATPVRLVVLVQGNEWWMGNDTYLPSDDLDRKEGGYRGLVPALDELAKLGPPGSVAALITYQGGRTLVKHPIGDIRTLNGRALGPQQDYAEPGTPFIAGLIAARHQLRDDSGKPWRRVLIVFGDGTGLQEEISQPLARAIDDLRRDGVETFTICYDGMSQDPQGPRNMQLLGYTGYYRAVSRESFVTYATAIVDQVATTQGTAVASPAISPVQSEYGPPASGLRLAFEVDAAGTAARFRVRNVGTKPVTFTERYSCSGYHSWWLTGGAAEAHLTTTYAYEPSRDGLTAKPLSTVCTVNVPKKSVTVRPGRVATVTVPFAQDEQFATSGVRFFQAHALLDVEGRSARVQLETPIVSRTP